MAEAEAIQTEAQHEAALARIGELMEAEVGTPEGSELDALVSAVEEYESRTVKMGFPGPIAAIEFRLEQAGLCPDDLIPVIGSREEVSRILSGKLPIAPSIAFALQELLGIPAESLVTDPAVLG